MRFKYIQQYTVIFFTVLWEISGRQTESINHHHPKWLVNVPKDFENITWPTVGRRLQPSRSNSTFIKKCDEIRGQNPGGRNVGIDFEQLYALENFFWSMNDGLSLELGAIDGTSWNHEAPSQTAAFLEFGWNRILIEANPTYRTPMAKYSPESFSINAAICNEKMLHYIVGSRVKAPAGGIIEFMAPTFIKQFFPFLMSDSENFENFRVENLNWSSVSIPKDHTLIEVACLTLQKALDRAGTSHVNFFILDVEGSELEVLKTIDWRRTSFDVLCIETDKAFRPPGYADVVTNYMALRGYKHHRDKGRNSWFVRDGYVASKRPPCCPVPPLNRHGD